MSQVLEYPNYTAAKAELTIIPSNKRVPIPIRHFPVHMFLRLL